MGRPRIPVPTNFAEMYEKCKNGKILAVTAMSLMGLSKTTYYRMVLAYEEQKMREEANMSQFLGQDNQGDQEIDKIQETAKCETIEQSLGEKEDKTGKAVQVNAKVEQHKVNKSWANRFKKLNNQEKARQNACKMN